MSDSYSSLATTKTTHNHAIIILASGLSQRLGQPKQLLKKQSQPLMRHMTELALATKPQTLIVVVPSQNAAISTAINEIAKQNLNLQIILNSTPEVGMAHSLSLAIEALSDSQNADFKRVLILGIDQVLLENEHLQQLLAGNNTLVASSYPNLENSLTTNKSVGNKLKSSKLESRDVKTSVIGLPLVIDYDLLKQWQPLLEGDKGLRHLLRALPFEQVSTVINPQLSYDIDTPIQLSHAREQGWLDKDS